MSNRTTGHYKAGDRVYLQGYPHITGTVLGPLVVGGLLGPEHRDRNYVLVRWDEWAGTDLEKAPLRTLDLSFHRVTGWGSSKIWRIIGVAEG